MKQISNDPDCYAASDGNEIRQIFNYPDYYIESNGEIFSNKYGKVKQLKTAILRNGYEQVTLCNDGVRKKYYIHRLVAIAFIPNPENKPQVNHIDFCRTNNNVSNLEWNTAGENVQYGWDNGRCENTRKMTAIIGSTYRPDRGASRRKAVVCVDTGEVFPSVRTVIKLLGLKSRNSIMNAIRKGYRSCGFHWKYQ